jgi:hypothetical protein
MLDELLKDLHTCRLMFRNLLVHYFCPATPAHAGASTSLTEEKFLTVEIRPLHKIAPSVRQRRVCCEGF